MLKLDELRIGDKYSYKDFSASVRDRKISAPVKKKIKETVPFSNETYDFTSINGEIYWEERTLEYVLEMDAETAEQLESKKIDFKTWVMNVEKQELHDPYIKDYHFLATFDDIEFDDSEFEKTTITVVFTAYPYMLANNKKSHEFQVTTTESTVEIVNKSSHKITPTFIASVPVTVTIGDTTYSMGATTVTDEKLALGTGTNSIKIKTTATSGTRTLKVEFVEEVF